MKHHNKRAKFSDVKPQLDYRRETEKLRKESDALTQKRKEHSEAKDKFLGKEKLLDNLLHEIRHICGDLKNVFDGINLEEDPRFWDIWAHVNLLSIRMRMYDFEVNPSGIRDSKKLYISIYRKIDKITKCLNHLPNRKHHIRLVGNSFLSYYATDVLELAFYIILRNALKYAIQNTEITVKFEERQVRRNKELSVEFQNEAQLPKDEEMELLTERGYRGNNSSGKPGSGIGLYTLKQICDEYNVKLKIFTNPSSPGDTRGSFCIRLTFNNCQRNG